MNALSRLNIALIADAALRLPPSAINGQLKVKRSERRERARDRERQRAKVRKREKERERYEESETDIYKRYI